MAKYTFIPLSLCLMCLFACEEVIVVNSLDRAIVQAYLYAGSSVDDIRLSQPLPFGVDEDSTGPPINDVNILLTHNGEDFALSPSPGDSGYYHYNGEDLEILEGETYQLSFTYKEVEITSETTVPPPPTGLNMSQSELILEPVTAPMQIRTLAQMPPIDLYWDYQGDVYYYLLIENTVDSTEEILQLQGGGPGGGGGGRLRARFSFISTPFQDNSYAFQIPSLTEYGLHRVVLFRVNQEYVDLYETLEQDSRDLSEPLNNIQNGLGVFAAFNSDTVWLDVRKP